MNQESLMSILRDLAGPQADVSKMEKLIQLSGRALELMQLKLKTTDPKKSEEIHNAIVECQKELSKEYDRFVLQMGLDKGDLEKYVQDSRNFTHTQWETIQNFKSKLDKHTRVVEKPECSEGGKRRALAGSKKWMNV